MSAPKGNLFGIGNTGKPRKYESCDELAIAINKYFDYIQGEKETIKGVDSEGKDFDEEIWVRKPESPTVTGMALSLGFASKQSIYDNIKVEEFSYLLKRAITVIENHHEKRMDGDKVVGSIFVLKNMGWTDRIEQTLQGGDNPIKTIDYGKLSTEALKEIINLPNVDTTDKP